MAFYSIKELEQLSNVKAHTIRIWELRYKILTPERTDTNIRLYDDDQLKKLLNVCALMNNGMKISQVSKLSVKEIGIEIDKLIASINPSNQQQETIISQMIIAITNFDETHFEKTFANSILRFGLLSTYSDIIYPLLIRVGLLWTKSDIIPAQEHFMSNLIKQKLFAAIDAMVLPSKPDQTWILFLNEYEEHEIGLLFANYILRKQGKKVIYLGQKVPYDNLSNVILKNKPTHIITFFVKKHFETEINQFLKRTKKDFKNVTICLTGNEEILSKIASEDIKIIHNIHSLIQITQK